MVRTEKRSPTRSARRLNRRLQRINHPHDVSVAPVLCAVVGRALHRLRIQVLREVTLSSRQAIGLEPWGRMKINYEGLDASLPWFEEHTATLGMTADERHDPRK